MSHQWHDAGARAEDVGPGGPREYEGWNAPIPEHLPRRTLWPVATALGTVLIFWGVVTSYLIFAAGVGLLALSVVGWIQEIRAEGRSDE